jgi:lipopolysaccharide/colanic/teichoic acid biosynthesis glycosyltransferase
MVGGARGGFHHEGMKFMKVCARLVDVRTSFFGLRLDRPMMVSIAIAVPLSLH